MNLRRAKTTDAEEISALLNQLGYKITGNLIARKISEFSSVPVDDVFVAEVGGEVVGTISCHIDSLFHQEGNSGRITSLVVDHHYRGRGVGKALVTEAESFFHSYGCVKSEVTSGEHRPEAHAFYESCGYQLDERRFLKLLS